ncbi:Fibrobacter succinogenes major paralogous domain [Candidatus Ornithobacterium hominis]|uniref:FISUMP domain-containing protein n=1 Tax=Candidatus Ornithobacterium hominis TaxID=2497989 RepID=UPI0024BCB61B|nr:FISUMP domain-containing protein [Candidatus Ornithobacterium hominis]CAI9429803.1 Fibrobacter succinogenes major paralogous domain [Candidatus Ornithobacterium hominis]
MKKLLFSFVVLPGALATAQVGINTEEPKAMLDISAKDNQRGDLRIQDVEMKEKTDWLLIWDEKDQMVKRTSLSDLKYDMTVDKGKINYIRSKHPDKADDIINKIKQCTPENILFDRHFGDGKHDFVYCATTVSEGGYNRTWLTLNLGAAYADINNPDFDPTVSKIGTDAHNEAKTYGSLYQWQRASDGHEFRDSETTTELADTWTDTGDSAGNFIIGDFKWVDLNRGENASDSNLLLWRPNGVNNPCPSGYHVPMLEEWEEFYKAVTGNDLSFDSKTTHQIFTQDKLPNLAAAGFRNYGDLPLQDERSHGFYWSSSSHGIQSLYAYYVNFSNDSSSMTSIYPATGYSVRCIKNN